MPSTKPKAATQVVVQAPPRLTVSSERIKCLDRYLVLSMRQRRTRRLTWDECTTLARSAWADTNQATLVASAAAPVESVHKETVPSTATAQADVTEEERYLVDFFTVTSPTLYRLQRVAVAVPGSQAQPPIGSNPRYLHHVESVSLASEVQRNQQLQTVLSAPRGESNNDAVEAFVRNAMLDQLPPILPERPVTTAPVTASTPETDPTHRLESTNRTRQTVEERVRARAAMAHQDAVHAMAHHTSTNDGTTAMTIPIVRLADAVWSHAQGVRTARPAGSTARRRTTARPHTCRVPLVELTHVLQTSLVVRGTGVAYAVQGERPSKRHVVDALVTLAGRFPTWVQILDDSTTSLPSKHAVVLIRGVDYQAIRNELVEASKKRPRPRTDRDTERDPTAAVASNPTKRHK